MPSIHFGRSLIYWKYFSNFIINITLAFNTLYQEWFKAGSSFPQFHEKPLRGRIIWPCEWFRGIRHNIPGLEKKAPCSGYHEIFSHLGMELVIKHVRVEKESRKLLMSFWVIKLANISTSEYSTSTYIKIINYFWYFYHRVTAVAHVLVKKFGWRAWAWNIRSLILTIIIMHDTAQDCSELRATGHPKRVTWVAGLGDLKIVLDSVFFAILSGFLILGFIMNG